MPAKKEETPVHSAPLTFRDFPGEVPEPEPTVVAVATEPEPAKPATPKEK